MTEVLNGLVLWGKSFKNDKKTIEEMVYKVNKTFQGRILNDLANSLHSDVLNILGSELTSLLGLCNFLILFALQTFFQFLKKRSI